MPSFLKEFRRRSKASFHTDHSSSNESNGSSSSNLQKSKSDSTLSTTNGSTTPPSTLPSANSFSSLKAMNGVNHTLPTRPTMHTNRYSINGVVSPTSSGSQRTLAATSPLAPRVLSVSDNSWVNQKVLLIYGQVGDPAQKPLDGTVTVLHHLDSFPPTNWPVCDSHFKALVHLQPGPNRLRIDFNSPRISSNTSSPAHSSWININYLPLNSSPPLQLAILVASDSPLTYDAVPERVQREGNGLETATRKFRMAAYLWQAFTGEQMNRNGFGRRCFCYEEEWQQGTLTYHDAESGQMRSEAKIHIIKLDKTVAEIQDLELAQQYENATKKGDLFGIAMDAVKAHFRPKPGQTRYVSCMFLDTHWDPVVRTVRGHAALGGGDDTVKLAIFGSHALQSYPASIEEVVPAFSDCTRTDTSYVANDCNDSGSNWEAVNIGIGAHLHETGHLFSCPHQESGIMLRDYVRLNRTFTCREPYSTRTKSPGQRLVLQGDECAWHRLDCLRFRFHPCFRLLSDPPLPADDGVQVWTVDNGNVLVTAATGVAFVELFTDGDDLCRAHVEYLDPAANASISASANLPRQICLAEPELRARLPEDRRQQQQQQRRLKLVVHSAGGRSHAVPDFGALASKASRVKLPDGRWGFRGGKVGFSQMEGSRPEGVVLASACCRRQKAKLLTAVRVYHGLCVDGVEFVYEDATSQLFGKRGGGRPGGSEFQLDTRRGELLIGFYLRAGLWIDGLQILTSLGRKSEVFGNAAGGSGHTLIPPRGYTIGGISGSCAQWLDGFALIITR